MYLIFILIGVLISLVAIVYKDKIIENIHGLNLVNNQKKQSPGKVIPDSSALTDCGLVRTNNEDSFLCLNKSVEKSQCRINLTAIADGMGGAEYGELASSLVIDSLRDQFNQLNLNTLSTYHWENWLLSTYAKANCKLQNFMADIKFTGLMGTTLVTALIIESTLYLANIGDSRCYLQRNKQITPLTKDHSLVQLMLEKNLITADEVYTHPRRGELMRFIGQGKDIEVDIFKVDLQAEDKLLLCSDGLWGMVRDHQINQILSENTSLETTCEKLIKEANNEGGKDNVSVIITEIKKG